MMKMVTMQTTFTLNNATNKMMESLRPLKHEQFPAVTHDAHLSSDISITKKKAITGRKSP
jgi:hypothetical protein